MNALIHLSINKLQKVESMCSNVCLLKRNRCYCDIPVHNVLWSDSEGLTTVSLSATQMGKTPFETLHLAEDAKSRLIDTRDC